jgi:hypothetical protein
VAEKYFYNSRGDAISTSYVENANQEYKGKNLDGDSIYHTNYFDKQRRKHISYDTIVVRGEHHYIMGSGHEQNHGSDRIDRWDSGNKVTWQDAIGRRTNTLIR